MKAAPFELVQFAWLALTITVGALQITASVILVRERHVGPWMMLAGAFTSLIAGIVSQLASILNYPLGLIDNIELFYQAISGIGSLGWLCFTIGLLLYALHRRSQSHRIAELERLLTSLQD